MIDDMRCDKLQVCVVVKNLDEAMKRYTDLLGIGPFVVYTVDSAELPGITRDGRPTAYKVRVGMTRIGSGLLELLENVRGQTIWKDFYDKHGEGVHHIGLVMRNYSSALAAFTSRGYKVTVDGPIEGKDRIGRFTYMDTEDKMGTTLEILDFPEDLLASFG
jgi:methylmalonyl-CoA/ethylmalonyl-CoA epimerase